MAPSYRKPQKIKIILLATIFIALGAVAAIYIGYRQQANSVARQVESVEPDATLSIDKIHQTATRDGKKEWHLEADSGHYIEKTRQLILKRVKVIFFLEDNSEIILSADQGILKTDVNDIEVSGNVMVKNKDYKLLTENLSYSNDRRMLFSKSPVTISGASAHLAAASLLFDLEAQKLTLEGRVATTIDEDFSL